jgi:hypothetical protein
MTFNGFSNFFPVWVIAYLDSYTLKFAFERIPETYRRLTTENILAEKGIF